MSAPISQNVPKFSLSETASSVGNGIKTGFNWVLDKVTLVASAVFSFLRDTVLPFAKDVATKTVTFLRTNAGAAVAGVLGTAGLLYTARSKEGEENKNLRTVLYVASAATATLAITATVLGFTRGFSANIV